MYEHRILIDLSHMRADAIDDTFALLEQLDREHGADPTDFPVVATHAGYRFGDAGLHVRPRDDRSGSRAATA